MEVGVLSVPCPLRAADSCVRDCRLESGPTRTRRTVHAGAGHRKRGPGPFLSLLCLRNINFFAALANPETVWKGYPILYLVEPGRRTSPGRPTTLPGTPAVCTPPRLVPNVVILLQAISKGAKRPHFPARSSRKLRRRALSISRGAKRAGVGGGRKNDLFRYSTRFRYRNSNSSPRRIRASRVTDPDSLTARGSRQSCHHPEGIRRDPVTAAGRLRPPRPLSVSIREVVRAEGSPRGKPHERFHPDQERAGGAGAGRRSAPERPAVRREGAKPGLRRSSSTWRKVLFLAWPRAWPAENRSPAG